LTNGRIGRLAFLLLKNLNTAPLHADGAMAIRVYNSLSRTKEEFVPLHGNRVSMFVCGLTPQDETHMGHAKTYVAFDVVARFLRHKGYRVFYLQNVTDIEDRIIDKMRSTGRAWNDIVSQYFGEYLEVMSALGCASVDVYAFATDYLAEIIDQIQGLIDKGHAYLAEDGSVYYDTTTFSGWGRLSGQKVEALRPGARVAVEERKRHPADFVLWRAQKPGEPAWDSPWGKGRPGWHIEDTAITIRHFGPQYDLHGGATELLFPHHEAEIAQAEAFTGVAPFVKYWMHTGMVMVKGEEMHKSLGNYWPVKAALKLYEPDVIRFFLVNVQYRGPIDFTPDLIDEAKRAYERLRETVRSVDAERRRAPESGKGDRTMKAATTRALSDFDAAMSDDFNTREAVAVMFDYSRAVNKALESGAGRTALDEVMRAFGTFSEILGILPAPAEGAGTVDRLLDLIVALREDARKRKDFAAADRIRDVLAAAGVDLEDTRDGVRWKRR
jgi:cysteinyl-tRNA synthetase